MADAPRKKRRRSDGDDGVRAAETARRSKRTHADDASEKGARSKTAALEASPEDDEDGPLETGEWETEAVYLAGGGPGVGRLVKPWRARSRLYRRLR